MRNQNKQAGKETEENYVWEEGIMRAELTA